MMRARAMHEDREAVNAQSFLDFEWNNGVPPSEATPRDRFAEEREAVYSESFVDGHARGGRLGEGQARFKLPAIFETLELEDLRARLADYAAARPRVLVALALACAAGVCCVVTAWAWCSPSQPSDAWHREARAAASSSRGGHLLHRELMRPADGAATASPVDGFVPVSGGADAACRSAAQKDDCDGDDANQTGCFVFTQVAGINDCKDLCIKEETCTGIEYSSEFKRCEVWKLSLGVGAPVEGFQCLAYHRPCSAFGESCQLSGCCLDVGSACYRKDDFWAGCRSECVPGESDSTGPDKEPWSCIEVQKPGRSNETCSAMGEDCSGTGCCNNPALRCFEKTSAWAGCRPNCEPGQPDSGPGADDEPWSCKEIGPKRSSGSDQKGGAGGLHVLGAGGGAVEKPAEGGAQADDAAGKEWSPAVGGQGHCSVEGSEDVIPTEAHKFASLDRCKALCKALETCTGIEYSAAFGYCELWQMPIKSSIPGDGFVCLSLMRDGFEDVAAVGPSRFKPLDGGVNRACSLLDRGLTVGDEDMAVILQSGNGDQAVGRLRRLQEDAEQAVEEFDGVASLGDCQALCASQPVCMGIGYTASDQSCMVWEVPFEGTTESEGSVCLTFSDDGQGERPWADPGADAEALEEKLASVEVEAGEAETADGVSAEAPATADEEAEGEETGSRPQAAGSPTFLCIAVVPEEAASAETKLLKQQFESSRGIFSCEGSTLFFGRDMGKIFERIRKRSEWSSYDWTIVVHTNVVFDASRFSRVAALLQTDVALLHQMYYIRNSHNDMERGPIEIISKAAFQVLFNCSSTSASPKGGVDPYGGGVRRCTEDGGVRYETYPWLLGDVEKTKGCTDSSTFAFNSSFNVKDWTKCSDAATDLPSHFLEV